MTVLSVEVGGSHMASAGWLRLMCEWLRVGSCPFVLSLDASRNDALMVLAGWGGST
jgi:hypothetical protein